MLPVLLLIALLGIDLLAVWLGGIARLLLRVGVLPVRLLRITLLLPGLRVSLRISLRGILLGALPLLRLPGGLLPLPRLLPLGLLRGWLRPLAGRR